MPFPETFLDTLVERCDIVDTVSSYVQLSKKGGNYFGLCPFHNEKTGSFSVSPDKQIYYCFGCHKGGGVINFIMEIENLSYPDAVHFLAERVGMTVPEDGQDQEIPRLRKRLLSLNREAARWFFANLDTAKGEKARAYLDKRKITRKTAVRFGLGVATDGWYDLIDAMGKKGYSPTELVQAGLAVPGSKAGAFRDKFYNRLMFPVLDVRGEVVGFSGRALDEGQEPKYLNSPETLVFSKRHTLFGINLAKNTKRGSFLLVEGNVDVVTLHQAGFDNAVASMGTALTVEQTRLISRYAKEIVICYDNDPAGRKATDRALEILKNSEFTVRVLKLPDRIEDGKTVKIDADDFIKLNGANAFEQLLHGSGGSMEYRLLELASRYDLSRDEQRVEFLQNACGLVAALVSPVEREVWSRRTGEMAGVKAESVQQEVERKRKRMQTSEKKRMDQASVRPSGSVQPKEKKLRYENVRSALAEEGIIRLMLLDPSLIAGCTLTEQEFSSAFLGKLYVMLKNRQKEGMNLSASALTALLEQSEANQLTQLLQKPESGGDAAAALRDYVDVIRRENILAGGDLSRIQELMKKKTGTT